jgi:acetyl coenzyme A synthetase (ADP forming)-like protein
VTQPASADPRYYAADEILRDGGSIHVRAIRSDDKDRLLEHFGNLSPRSVYFRFLGAKTRLTTAELRYLTELDFVERVGLVATLRDGDRESIVGAGYYFARTDEQAPHRAEVAFAVVDAHQRRGIGTLLLEHLARIARPAGITEFEADVLGENNRMMEVFDKSGFRVSRSIEARVFHISFPTAATEEYREAARAREREAEAQSVRVFLQPRAVAVVGASRRAGTIGAALVHNLQTGGFAGPIYPVNPHATDIAGLRAYPSVSSIGAPVDLAIIAVPAAAVEDVARDCAHAGVRGVVVISAGFAETSPTGLESQQRLLSLVRASGMRMVGPNCMGILNTDPAVALNATLAPTTPPAGNVAILSQSGALGLAVLDNARTLDIGLSTFVSVGNKADVSGNDLLSYWLEDPRTAVIVLYLESLGNPRKFAWLAPEVARTKPIVAVTSGRSAAGRRAASSQSAALAGLDVAVEALFEQAGVIRTDTLAQLFDVVALLSTQPAPLGPRVGVVTNAGGPAILLADACEAHGLVLPEIAPAAQEALRAFLPATANVANPVDMIASATPEQYARALEIVGNDPSIDAAVAIYMPVLRATSEDIAAAIARAAGAVPTQKPVLTVFMSSHGAPALLGAGPRGRLPSYGFPENAALALAAAERYGRWRQRPSGVPLMLTPFGKSAIRAVIDRVLTDAAAPCWLETNDVATVLRAAGIALAAGEETSLADAEAVAERIGYPLVAKVMHADILQKSDAGGAITGLDSAAAVRAAVLTLAGRMAASGRTLERVLLQREVRGGIEALIGVTSDPRFGPLLVLGYGGVLVELLRDVSCRLLPVTDVDAAEMIAKLRASALLDGYRGTPPGDRAALASALMRVSALAEIVPELRELDLDPVKVLAPGHGVVVLDARVRIAPS